MTDRDGDLRMRNLDDSASEHSSHSSSMFPNEAAPTPPLSQSQNNSTTMVPAEKEDTHMSEAHDQAQQQAADPADGQAQANNSAANNPEGVAFETDENAPGHPWRNRRAVEEFEKISENVLDRGFNLQEFGDPVLDQLMEQDPNYNPYAPPGQAVNSR